MSQKKGEITIKVQSQIMSLKSSEVMSPWPPHGNQETTVLENSKYMECLNLE